MHGFRKLWNNTSLKKIPWTRRNTIKLNLSRLLHLETLHEVNLKYAVLVVLEACCWRCYGFSLWNKGGMSQKYTNCTKSSSCTIGWIKILARRSALSPAVRCHMWWCPRSMEEWWHRAAVGCEPVCTAALRHGTTKVCRCCTGQPLAPLHGAVCWSRRCTSDHVKRGDACQREDLAIQHLSLSCPAWPTRQLLVHPSSETESTGTAEWVCVMSVTRGHMGGLLMWFVIQ